MYIHMCIYIYIYIYSPWCAIVSRPPPSIAQGGKIQQSWLVKLPMACDRVALKHAMT